MFRSSSWVFTVTEKPVKTAFVGGKPIDSFAVRFSNGFSTNCVGIGVRVVLPVLASEIAAFRYYGLSFSRNFFVALFRSCRCVSLRCRFSGRRMGGGCTVGPVSMTGGSGFIIAVTRRRTKLSVCSRRAGCTYSTTITTFTKRFGVTALAFSCPRLRRFCFCRRGSILATTFSG